MKMSRPYAPLRADTQPIRTLSVFVGSVAMDFAPKLAKIGGVGPENELFTFFFSSLGFRTRMAHIFSIL